MLRENTVSGSSQKTRKFKLSIHKKQIIIFLDIQIIFLSYLFSFLIRFDFTIPPHDLKMMIYTFPIVLTIKLFTYMFLPLHSIIWRYISVQDLFSIVKASTINNLIYGIIFYMIFQWTGYPRSVIFIDWILFIMMFSGIRIFYKHYFEKIGYDYHIKKKRHKKRCMIIGAGDGGEYLIRAMINNQINYEPVCIIDSDQSQWNKYIHGIKIQGPLEKVHELAKRFNVEEIIIAIPSASDKVMKEILKYVEPCRESNISYKTVPSFKELISGRIPLTAIRDIRLADLINRDLVIIDKKVVMDELRDKVVMVTGAAGSIGSELVRQIAEFKPELLILIDRNENNLMYLTKEIDDLIPVVKYNPILADITDELKMEKIFNEHRPQYIFHTAAYKHVPFMENSTNEAIKNNVLGSKIMTTLADKYKAYKFVLISTDKAVNPINIMGCTKKLSELYILNNFNNSSTNYIIVRFGNVLGSDGSMIPIFKKQIKRGKALTVTHPDMCRYLMTIPEAVSLTLEASSIGNHKDILILDMGKQIKILEIAENLIKLSGLKPYVDIPIQFTGIRPGEKLYEELWDNYENPIQTNHPKIFKVPQHKCDNYFNLNLFNQLISGSLKHEKIDKNRILMKKLVPTYEYQNPDKVLQGSQKSFSQSSVKMGILK